MSTTSWLPVPMVIVSLSLSAFRKRSRVPVTYPGGAHTCRDGRARLRHHGLSRLPAPAAFRTRAELLRVEGDRRGTAAGRRGETGQMDQGAVRRPQRHPTTA